MSEHVVQQLGLGGNQESNWGSGFTAALDDQVYVFSTRQMICFASLERIVCLGTGVLGRPKVRSAGVHASVR
jgi:hypothetical protein